MFRFTEIDVKKKDDRIVISMDEYAKSLENLEIRDGKSDEVLTREINKIVVQKENKISFWKSA